MNTHPRIRKTVKWGGLAASVGLAVVWVSSAWWRLVWVPRVGRLFVGIGSGVVDLNQEHPGSREDEVPTFTAQFTPPFLVWSFGWSVRGPVKEIRVPLWFLALVSGAATAAVWRCDARAARAGRWGSCPCCGYDRRGLPAGAVCPECGGAASAHQAGEHL